MACQPIKTKIIFKSIARILFFDELGTKFEAKYLKKIMDFLYIIFEKIIIHYPPISDNYLTLYEELVKKEVNLGKINSNDKILVIGCGSLPSTTVLIYFYSKAKITSIDIDKKATFNAKKFSKCVLIISKKGSNSL